MGGFIFNSKWHSAGRWEKERGMTFNPAVWRLTLSRTLGDTTGKMRRSPGVKRVRNVGGHAEERAATQVSSQAACGSFRAVLTFSDPIWWKAKAAEASWRYSLKENLVKILISGSDLVTTVVQSEIQAATLKGEKEPRGPCRRMSGRSMATTQRPR